MRLILAGRRTYIENINLISIKVKFISTTRRNSRRR